MLRRFTAVAVAPRSIPYLALPAALSSLSRFAATSKRRSGKSKTSSSSGESKVAVRSHEGPGESRLRSSSFDAFQRSFFDPFGSGGGGSLLNGFDNFFDPFDLSAPRVRLHESDKAATIELEVPRYRKEDISVTSNTTEGTLLVQGKASAPSKDGDEDYSFENFFAPTYSRGQFRRRFFLPSEQYDLGKAKTTLEHGVMKITVPKIETSGSRDSGGDRVQRQQQQQSVPISGGDTKGKLATTTSTPAQFLEVSKAQWPPNVRRDETPSAVTYTCDLPPSITQDHVKVDLVARALRLTVAYEYTQKSAHREESQSLTYSTALLVPDGTKASDVKAAFDKGKLTVTIAKTGAAAADGDKSVAEKQKS